MNKQGKKWIAFDFDVSEPVAKPPKQSRIAGKPQKTAPLKPPKSVPGKRSFNFEARLRPKSISDLAVHPKKILEVESWLKSKVIEKNTKETANFLLLTGPTGSGKSSTVQVVCESNSVSVSEWVNPADQFSENNYSTNQIIKFTEFLTDSKWNSLFSKCEKKVILVEEFPNAILRSPEEFSAVLEGCFYKGNYPIIFICTDSFDSGSNVSKNLFPQEILDKYNFHHINFNSCAVTLMKNALKRAQNLVQENLDLFTIASPSVVDAIISTSMGDIRCAVNQYYFASLIGCSDLPTVAEPTKAGAKRKRNVKAISVKSMMARDENLGIFHALGRVLNPKRLVEVSTGWKLQCDFDKLIDEFSTQPGTFIAFLFENYLAYFGDFKDACNAAEILSVSQIFLEKWMDGHRSLIFALWVAVLGLMVFNEHKVSRWNQIKGPTKVNKRINDIVPATRNLSVSDMFYYNVITNSNASNFKII